MLKLLLTAAPYLIKVPSTSSPKKMARSLLAITLFVISGIAFTAAAFVYITSLYGMAIGFLSVSLMFFIPAVIIFYMSKPRKLVKDTSPALSTSDPIAAFLPDSVLRDPLVKRTLSQVSENPIAASALAALVGMLITREFMGD